MKKVYTEPQMIVEDFTVSEMIAADCKLAETQVTFVMQMNGYGKICSDGTESYFTDDPTGMRGAAYATLTGVYYGNFDTDHDGTIEGGGDGVHPTSDLTFNPAWRQKVIEESGVDSACHVDGSKLTFDDAAGIQCTTDTSLLQNS